MLRIPNAISFPISQIRSTFARVDVFHHCFCLFPIFICIAIHFEFRFVNWPHVSTKRCAFEWVMLTVQKEQNKNEIGLQCILRTTLSPSQIFVFEDLS